MTDAINLYRLRLVLVTKNGSAGIAIDEHRIPSRSREYRKLIRRVRAAVKRGVSETPENIQKIITMAAPALPRETPIAVISTSFTTSGKWRVELLTSPACDGVPGLLPHLQGVCDRVLKEAQAV